MQWMKSLMAGVIREDEGSRAMDCAILAVFIALGVAAVIQVFDLEPLPAGTPSAVGTAR